MKSKLLISAVAASLISLTALTGCASHPTNAQIGTATGAVVGGGLFAVGAASARALRTDEAQGLILLEQVFLVALLGGRGALRPRVHHARIAPGDGFAPGGRPGRR